MLEIEQKYLLDASVLRCLKKNNIKYKNLTQYYTDISKEKSVRFRKEDKKYYKTIKLGKGAVREENEKEISKAEYEKSMKKALGSIIKKRRYFFDIEDFIYSVDVYEKPFSDLYILEVEFEDIKRYENFHLPVSIKQYVKKEVTEDEAYKNKNLALFGKPLLSESEKNVSYVLMKKLSLLKSDILKYREKVLESKDDEALHQFRISLRKSASLLSEFSFLCEDGDFEDYKSRLKEIITLTNKKRDLDVMQSSLEKVKESLHNEQLIKTFDGLHNKLRKELLHESVKIIKYLHSSDFTLLMHSYGEFIESGYKEHISFYGRYGISEVLQYLISNRLAKIKKMIKKFNKDFEIQRLHKLRISFKKLRYISESFSEYFDQTTVKNFTKELKKLQNILGDFHDIYQQKELFKNLKKEQAEDNIKFLIDNVILPKLDKKEKKALLKVEKRIGSFMKSNLFKTSLIL